MKECMRTKIRAFTGIKQPPQESKSPISSNKGASTVSSHTGTQQYSQVTLPTGIDPHALRRTKISSRWRHLQGRTSIIIIAIKRSSLWSTVVLDPLEESDDEWLSRWPQHEEPIGDATFEPSQDNSPSTKFDQPVRPDEKTPTSTHLSGTQTGRYNVVSEGPPKTVQSSRFWSCGLSKNAFSCRLRGIRIKISYWIGKLRTTATWRPPNGFWEDPYRHLSVSQSTDRPRSLSR